MARKAEGTGKIRADLEGATLALVDIEEAVPFVRQRICAAVGDAKAQIHAASGKLMER